MNQPVYWGVLLGIAGLVGLARLVSGGPLLRRQAVSLRGAELLVAGAAVLALVFHCASMFFAPLTDALPGGRALGDSVRGMGPASQWAYWLPAVGLLLSLRRVWWPGPALLAASLAGVGYTMYWPSTLNTHLGWLAAAVVTVVLVTAALVGHRSGEAAVHDREKAPVS